MARSQFTVSELRAQAMLLGQTLEYDPYDHSFYGAAEEWLDADTLEPVEWVKGHFEEVWNARKTGVDAGIKGAKDYDPKRPYYGETTDTEAT